jgi:Tfp pilus assembly protein PilE
MSYDLPAAAVLKPRRQEVDNEPVVRAFGLVSVLVALAVAGYLYTHSAETVQPSGGSAVQDLAVEAAAEATLLAAKTGVESFFATSGTYAGATVPPGVTLVAADAASYCLQVGAGAATRHVAGPGGSPAPGPCP